MFGFLRDKLKAALSKFTKKVEEEVKEKTKEVKKETKKKEAKEKKKEVIPARKESPAVKKAQKKLKEKKKEVSAIVPEQKVEKPGFFAKLFGKKEEEKPEIEEKKEAEVITEKPEVQSEQSSAVPKEKKGFFAKITEAVTTTSLSEEKFESLFWDLEAILLENNVAVEVIERIKEDMKETLVKGKISRFNVDETILSTLKQSIDKILTFRGIDLVDAAKKKKPLVLSFIGVNGSGKTTTIAKLAHYLLKHHLTVVLAAADTFRAAAIQQLEEHANRLGVRLIKHDYGADAAAVAFDAVKYAQAKNIDVVLIDTAGRLHSNINLMDEMKKIVRVAKPDYKIFVGESITGNDCVEQAQQFNDAITIDGIILAKADVDEKGGAALSVAYVTKKPILFLGTGQNYNDLEQFNKKEIIKSLGL